ncbi:MAG: hypothetical protein F4030_13785 [Gammaproteobacteria bacterium]|nr:hypothetical protein [Gammaproteobacteria bacterium]MYH86807.1 hypothetical protein [Gammaproteobacteria bacterium]MYK06046.1 hypothetical protein [Gammaproteobacteria bacterium]
MAAGTCSPNPLPATERPDMIPISSRLAALAAVAMLASFAPGARAAAQQDPVAELDALLGGISTLSADVSQLILESGGGLLEESTILMRLRKPGGFYWETLDPFPELIVTDGDTLWNYQPDLEQVVIENWDRNRAELAAQLLNGETGGLAEEYRLTLVTAPELHRFELLPLAPDSPYALIAIEFVAEELDIIRLDNRSGQQTVWRFINLERNVPMEDSLFVFSPPPGIEIVDSRTAD